MECRFVKLNSTEQKMSELTASTLIQKPFFSFSFLLQSNTYSKAYFTFLLECIIEESSIEKKEKLKFTFAF